MVQKTEGEQVPNTTTTTIIIIQQVKGTCLIDLEAQGLAKEQQLAELPEVRLKELSEFNTFKIPMLRKSSLIKPLVRALKKPLLMRHHIPSINCRSGERNFGVSRLFLSYFILILFRNEDEWPLRNLELTEELM